MDSSKFNDNQLHFAEKTKTCCRENRIGLIKMLLGNLRPYGIRNVQNITAKIVTRRKFSTEPTKVNLDDDEDGWWEWEDSDLMIDWAGYVAQETLVGYIKLILINYRRDELQEVRSTWTYHAREAIPYPERPVSRRKSAPGPEEWWSEYGPNSIIAVDCEMIPIKVGVRNNGKIRCKQEAATVSIVDFDGKVLKKIQVKHDVTKIHLTKEVKRITGFKEDTFKSGESLKDVREMLHNYFQKKLLILIGAESDFEALGMQKGMYDVFDLHQYYQKDSEKIGLRSLVHHYYHVDIQKGVHDPDIDAMYTIKIFREKYIPEKLANPAESFTRCGIRMFNEIKTLR